MGQQAPGPAGWVAGTVAAIVLLTGAARIAIDRVAGPVTASAPTSGAQAGAWFGAVMPGTSGSVDALLRIGDGAVTGAPRLPAGLAGQVPSPADSALLGGQRFESTVAAGTERPERRFPDRRRPAGTARAFVIAAPGAPEQHPVGQSGAAGAHDDHHVPAAEDDNHDLAPAEHDDHDGSFAGHDDHDLAAAEHDDDHEPTAPVFLTTGANEQATAARGLIVGARRREI